MNKILLLTTKGCIGCEIMRNSITKAIDECKKEISFEQRDVLTLGSKFVRTFGIKDFPTVLFFKDKELTRKEVGTRPYIVVLRWINIDF